MIIAISQSILCAREVVNAIHKIFMPIEFASPLRLLAECKSPFVYRVVRGINPDFIYKF